MGTIFARDFRPRACLARGYHCPMRTSEAVDKLGGLIADVPDFPTPGVVYKDFTPLLANAGALALAVELMANPYRGTGIDLVVGAESRGFIFGTPLAVNLGVGFVPVRKPGKLPRETYTEDFALEYDATALSIHKDDIDRKSVV